MAKNKKAGSTPSAKKITESASAKKPSRKSIKIDNNKVKLITDKINQINRNFETLIEECQIALKNLTQENLISA